MSEKLVVVINGKGGVGKDALIKGLSGRFKIMNISAIEPIKEIAKLHGWNGEKDDNNDSLLSDSIRNFCIFIQ